MQLEIRLKEILDKAGLDAHGRIQKIAKGAGVNRHTVRKLYNNEASTFSLETIARICRWLHRQRYSNDLPGALFGARPSSLLAALAEPRTFTQCLGEYRASHPEGFARAWGSRDDFDVANRLTDRIASWARRHLAPAEHGVGVIVRPQWAYAPSHIPADDQRRHRKNLKHDHAVAQRLFNRMRRDRGAGSVIYIGSQRANNCMELFVSGLLHRDPWTAFDGTAPFFLKFHAPLAHESCFGGNEAPGGAGAAGPAGVYFRERPRSKWRCFESDPMHRGAGMVIVRRDRGYNRLEVGVFGVSGVATAAMGVLLCDMPDEFWPEGGGGGLEVGAYACGFDLSGMTAADQSIETVTIGPPEIVPIRINGAGR